MKTPIVLVAFGTTSSARQAYAVVDDLVRQAFPEHEVVWAYSSRMVRDFSRQRHGLKWQSPLEVLEALHQQGFEWAVVQSLHLLAGHEFYRLVEEVKECRIRTAIGLPLLSSPEDYQAFVKALSSTFSRLGPEEGLILIGHGTDHPSWATYLALQYLIQQQFGDRFFVGVIEGSPSRKEVLAAVVKTGVKRVRLFPLMLVAGVHVQEDLAGPEDSWKTVLEEAGLAVSLEAGGLLTYPGIVKIFQDHIAAALDVIPGRVQGEGGK